MTRSPVSIHATGLLLIWIIISYMSSRLIILRGNSGCGKTTTAKLLQKEYGYGTMLVSQDVVRREMLHVKDEASNQLYN